jgi:hypothetical protein
VICDISKQYNVYYAIYKYTIINIIFLDTLYSTYILIIGNEVKDWISKCLKKYCHCYNNITSAGIVAVLFKHSCIKLCRKINRSDMGRIQK